VDSREVDLERRAIPEGYAEGRIKKNIREKQVNKKGKPTFSIEGKQATIVAGAGNKEF